MPGGLRAAVAALLGAVLAGPVGEPSAVAARGAAAGDAEAAVVAGAAARAGVPQGAPGARRADPAPGAFTGLGFDTCSAPSEAAMRAWRAASPYRAVGIYFGGINRGCAQPNLTPTWVANQQAAGWHLLPIYMGLQAPCTTSTKRHRIDPANAAAQGRAQAEDAVAAATALGLPPESVLILDMEAYRTDDAACREAVLTFVSAWNARLHDLSYLAGFYSSMASGVADQVAVYRSGSRVRPDYLDFARWDGNATVSDPAIPADYWAPRRRVKQYRGDHVETWGGVSMNIDNDYVDVAAAPATPFGDFDGNGWSDLLTRSTRTGWLHRYPGNGSFVTGPVRFGPGWNAMDAIVRPGDFDRDGAEDVIAREATTGVLWFYRGTRTGLQHRVRLATGWGGLREITAVGDMDRDGFGDLAAVDPADGYLYIYPGTGVGFRPRVRVGPGWNRMDELAGVGDLTRDGLPDLVARRPSTGQLFLYAGRGLALAPRVLVGGGWNAMQDLAGVGDFDRDGHPDLVAVQASTKHLFRYPGRASGLNTRIGIGTGWGNQRPLL
ncbi:MAG TPA: glycoside hydrolase domain-containing protein [Pilimelia sp.]|nr:glycoside hydrolase domain-containing protein [Pilimelia sp.]